MTTVGTIRTNPRVSFQNPSEAGGRARSARPPAYCPSFVDSPGADSSSEYSDGSHGSNDYDVEQGSSVARPSLVITSATLTQRQLWGVATFVWCLWAVVELYVTWNASWYREVVSWCFTAFVVLTTFGTIVWLETSRADWCTVVLLPLWLRMFGMWLMLYSPVISMSELVRMQVESLLEGVTEEVHIQRHYGKGEEMLIWLHACVTIAVTVVVFAASFGFPGQCAKSLRMGSMYVLAVGVLVIPCIASLHNDYPLQLCDREVPRAVHTESMVGPVLRLCLLLIRRDWKTWRSIVFVCLFPWPWFLIDLLVVASLQPRLFSLNGLHWRQTEKHEM